MDLSSVKKAYRFYAPVYDFVFGPIFLEGRKRAAAQVSTVPQGTVLEIGIGTGLSLPYYRSDVRVIGIDVSPEMLNVARRRAKRRSLSHVQELLEMDAQALEFRDNSMDGVVAMYVASVVPDPAAMIREMFRVARPGAPILFVNHFSSNARSLRRMEQFLSPFASRLGFHPDFPLDDFIATVGSDPESVESINLGGYWKLVTYRKPDAPQNGHGNINHGPLNNGRGRVRASHL